MTVPELAIAVLGMAVILYLTRIGGILLAARIPDSSPVLGWIDQLPAVTLMALVAPAIVHAGWPGMVAAGVAWLIAKRSGNVLVAMFAAVAVIALLQRVG